MTADERNWQRDQCVKYALEKIGLKNDDSDVARALLDTWESAYDLGYHEGIESSGRP